MIELKVIRFEDKSLGSAKKSNCLRKKRHQKLVVVKRSRVRLSRKVIDNKGAAEPWPAEASADIVVAEKNGSLRPLTFRAFSASTTRRSAAGIVMLFEIRR